MKCPRCMTDAKLIAERVNPRRSRAWDENGPIGTVTYRDYYYCPTCEEGFTAKVNIRLPLRKNEKTWSWKI